MVKNKTAIYVIDLIAVLIVFGFGMVVAPFGPVTDIGVSILGIFMGNYARPFMGIQLTTIGMANSVMGEYQLAFRNLTYFLTTVILLAVWLLVYTVMLGKVCKVNLKPLRELDVAKVESLKEISDHFNKRQIILIIA